MPSVEEFSLHWKDFKDNASQTFSHLGQSKEFADVTLACEDGEQVEAHKVILAGSSPFFLNILKRNNHAHPMIYMKGIDKQHILGMLDFIYKGEVRVPQDDLVEFLATADDLRVKGLIKATTDNMEVNPPIKEISDNIEIKPTAKEENLLADTTVVTNDKNKTFELDLIEPSPTYGLVEDDPWNQLNDCGSYSDIKKLDERIKTIMSTTSENLTGNQARQGKVRKCNMCGRKGTYTNIKDHIEGKHITNISLPCNICMTVFNSRKSLWQHKHKKHKQKISTSLPYV